VIFGLNNMANTRLYITRNTMRFFPMRKTCKIQPPSTPSSFAGGSGQSDLKGSLMDIKGWLVVYVGLAIMKKAPNLEWLSA
jgi:hypothetical protein